MSDSGSNGSNKTPSKQTPESERNVTNGTASEETSSNKFVKILQELHIDKSGYIIKRAKSSVSFKTLGHKIKNLFRRKSTPKRKVSLGDNLTLAKSSTVSLKISERLFMNEKLSQYSLTDKRSDVDIGGRRERITLYEEFRLVERPEKEINAAWKGAHLILFFLTFVFGSFCTFCFHILMYMFDEKCILSPKMVAVKDVKRSHPTGIIIDYIAAKSFESVPLEFVTTIWVDKSQCYLPTYVPLLSGICGLIWTTMFLMSSSGTQTLSGLQRPWRIVPAVFIFSTTMSILCIYTSVTTHKGLLELCNRLAEVFGSDTCSYTINVATLTYERRIRGVYQATRLTIAAAWLHTLCWVSAALLALARVLFVVDFRLVRVRADLIGNIELMLERHEKLIRTNEYWIDTDYADVSKQKSPESIKVHFVNKGFGTENETINLGDYRPKNIDNASKEENKFISTLVYNVLDQALDDKPHVMSPRSLLKRSSTRFLKTSSDNDVLAFDENPQQLKSKQTESEKTLTFKLHTDDEAKNKQQGQVPVTDSTRMMSRVSLTPTPEVKPLQPNKLWEIAERVWKPTGIRQKLENIAKSLESVNKTQGENDDNITLTPAYPEVIPKPGPSHTKDNPSPDEEKSSKSPDPKKEKEKQD